VGLASAERISEVVSQVIAAQAEIEIGVHLHSRPGEAAEKIRAAYEAGCRRFDAAIGGLGGCPFAQDALVGNIPTETLLAELAKLGAHKSSLRPLDELIRANNEIATKFGALVH
jgi:hydroxymethylglutaryl-CoA lyase